MAAGQEPFWHGPSVTADCPTVLRGDSPLVEGNRQPSLFRLGDQIREQPSQDHNTSASSDMSHMHPSMVGTGAPPGRTEGFPQSKVRAEGVNRPRIGHLDGQAEDVRRRAHGVAGMSTLNANGTLAVHETGKVSKLRVGHTQGYHESLRGVNYQCAGNTTVVGPASVTNTPAHGGGLRSFRD